MAIKLIAIDMDGLLLPDRTTAPAVKRVARVKRVNVVLTTEPSVCGCAQLPEKNFTWNSPAIIACTYNGALVVAKAGMAYGKQTAQL